MHHRAEWGGQGGEGGAGLEARTTLQRGSGSTLWGGPHPKSEGEDLDQAATCTWTQQGYGHRRGVWLGIFRQNQGSGPGDAEEGRESTDAQQIETPTRALTGHAGCHPETQRRWHHAVRRGPGTGRTDGPHLEHSEPGNARLPHPCPASEAPGCLKPSATPGCGRSSLLSPRFLSEPAPLIRRKVLTFLTSPCHWESHSISWALISLYADCL